MKRLGVEVIGDIIRLRAMCREVDSTNRKNELKQIITSGSKSRLGTSQNNAVARKPKARLVYVSWKHFDKKSQRYVLVKAKRGGGLAKFAFPHSAEKDTVLEEIVKHFLNAQKNVISGKRDDNFFIIMNEKEDPITDFITFPDGTKEQFTIGNYLSLIKLSRPRMFLYSKEKSSQQKVLTHRVILSDGEDDNVSEVDSGVLDLSEQFSLPVGGLPSFSTHSTPIGNPTQGSRHLIGSSEERRQLNFQIERAVHESTCY